MIPPFVSYVTFNRLGLTSKNITALLQTTEDFEMHIIDNYSKDNTWDFIKALKDERIKAKTRFTKNRGPVFAANYNLTKRKKDQYFFTVDSDVCIQTDGWISRFMEVFQAFPEVGLLGVMRGAPYLPLYPEVIPKSKDNITYLELKHADIDEFMGFVHGCCQCLRPELINEIGYWSEENNWGDAELSVRVNKYTDYKAGYLSDADFMSLIDIDMTQSISCDACQAKTFCKLDKDENTCFLTYSKYYGNTSFVDQFKWKYYESFKEIEEKKRTPYCASLFDRKSRIKYLYHKAWALENLKFYQHFTNQQNPSAQD